MALTEFLETDLAKASVFNAKIVVPVNALIVEKDALAADVSSLKAVKTATITTTWTGSTAPYTQTIAVTGVTANDKPIISPVYSATLATALLEKEAWGMVGKIETGAGNITVTCFEDKPVTAVNIQIKGV
ncbi:hypothetical protein [Acetobacterium wieringae]|uniref:hypothetical protein n=1 Tax=Acetobacterium wieringae TaxID=52694 RepID=UPI002B1EC0D5|nr:hypothetical protein [Acetobacterium wieringae]MEA4805072.1 hypothetical protein [Acetobacterium wieringae]